MRLSTDSDHTVRTGAGRGAPVRRSLFSLLMDTSATAEGPEFSGHRSVNFESSGRPIPSPASRFVKPQTPSATE